MALHPTKNKYGSTLAAQRFLEKVSDISFIFVALIGVFTLFQQLRML